MKTIVAMKERAQALGGTFYKESWCTYVLKTKTPLFEGYYHGIEDAEKDLAELEAKVKS